MKRTKIKTETNNYLFNIEKVGQLSAKGENVFFALDWLKEKNLIENNPKILGAFQKISKNNLVDITSILV